MGREGADKGYHMEEDMNMLLVAAETRSGDSHGDLWRAAHMTVVGAEIETMMIAGMKMVARLETETMMIVGMKKAQGAQMVSQVHTSIAPFFAL